MKVTTNYVQLLEALVPAFDAAVADVVAEAQRLAPKRTGRYANSIRSLMVSGPRGSLRAVVGSPLASARVKEKGGFIQGKQSRLYIPQGDGSVRTPESVRVRATPTVVPAGRRFPEFMTRRLREQVR